MLRQINLLRWKAHCLWVSLWTTVSSGALAASALIVLTLSGCAASPDVSKAYPPASLTADCVLAPQDVSTNGALARAYQAAKAALASCNNDKAALREWAKD